MENKTERRWSYWLQYIKTSSWSGGVVTMEFLHSGCLQKLQFQFDLKRASSFECNFNLTSNELARLRSNSARWPEGPKKHLFLEVFCPFFALFPASGPCTCTWQGYFEKKTVLSCFFWPQGPLIQSSAAPQGSPPPTQQINIRNTNHLSWAIN